MRRILCVAAMCLAANANAQDPNAGSLLNDLLEGRDIFSLPPVAPDLVRPQPEELPDIPGLRVAISSFEVRGSSLFSGAELQSLVSDLTGPQLSIRDLRKASERIATFYRENGWLVRVFLPRQDITQGRAIIQVQESRMGQVIYSQSPEYLERAIVDGILNEALPVNEPISLSAMDRALLVADDLAGISLVGALQSGVEAGHTDLAIDVENETRRRASVSLGNFGSYATGRNNWSLALSDASPFQRGGQVDVNASSSAGSKFLSGGYSFPAGFDGLILSVSGSVMSYSVENGAAASLNANGSSKSLKLDARYPIIRSIDNNLYLSASTARTSFLNRASNSVSSDYHKKAFSLGLSGNRFDGFGGGGVIGYGVDLNRSVLGGNRGSNASVLAGHYNFWTAQISRSQNVTDSISLFGQWERQHARSAVDSSDNVSVGGRSGVRAYPTGEGSAAEADQATLEGRFRLRQGPTVKLFYDWARVRDRDQSVGDYLLKGYGVAADVALPIGPTLSATWAKPIGDHPNPANGDNSLNQDGTAFGSRLWLSLTYDF